MTDQSRGEEANYVVLLAKFSGSIREGLMAAFLEKALRGMARCWRKSSRVVAIRKLSGRRR
jgi:hypothetical protein